MNNKREHAIVLGGSIAGLFTARILSDHFERVTIIERDPVHDKPESRKGQPQSHHLHGVLIPARRFIQKKLLGVEENLLDGGALTGDFGSDIRWWQFDGYRTNEHMDMQGITLSRSFLEYHVRCAVLDIQNVKLVDNTSADELILDEDGSRVIGVKVTHRSEDVRTEVFPADLVVDACGRGTPTPKWLEQLGYERPEMVEVKIRVSYTTRVYKRHGDFIENPQTYMIGVTPPRDKVGAFMFPIEGDRWIVTAGGYHGEHAPSDDEGFLDFMKNLPVPDIYNILRDAEPVSDIKTYKYPSSRRLRYDKLRRFPDGLLLVGDSVASFNPIYGQGMSSAALQVETLSDLLSQGNMPNLWRKFFAVQAEVIDLPWTLTVGEDFRYPETEGKKPLGIDLINNYVAMVHRATHTDKVVYRQFLNVMHLLAPSTSLIHPRILWRVLRAQARL